MLSLSELETRILRFAALIGENPHLRQLLSQVSGHGMQKAVAALATLLQARPDQVLAALRWDSPLRRNGLIVSSARNWSRSCDLDDVVEIDVRIGEVIAHPHESAEDLMRCFLQESEPATLAAADYPHLSAQRADLVALLRGALRERRAGVNVLLYGLPGTGKTEFARLLAAEAGAHLYEVKADDDDGDAADTGKRMLGFRLAQSFLKEAHDTLILFDEVEDVLGPAGNGTLSRLLGGDSSPRAPGNPG